MTIYVSNRETTAVWPQSVQLSQGRPFTFQLEGRTRKLSFGEFRLFFWPSWIVFMYKSNCHLIVITWFQCAKKILWVPLGSQIRHLWPR